MGTRIIAALVGLAIIAPLIYFGGIFVHVLVALVALIGIDEYARMAFPERRTWALVGMAPPALAIYVAALYGPAGSLVAAAVLGFFWTTCVTLFRSGPVDDAASASAKLLFGTIWAGALQVSLPLIRDVDGGLWWILLLLSVTWLGDSGAYFAGRALGKHKLYEKISPKKTWEGAIGGVLAAMAGAALIRHAFLPEMDLVAALVLAALLDVAGVTGDLAESMIKRSCGVKDSGSIMPGHGGILDRIDSLIFSGPLLYLYLYFFH